MSTPPQGPQDPDTPQDPPPDPQWSGGPMPPPPPPSGSPHAGQGSGAPYPPQGGGYGEPVPQQQEGDKPWMILAHLSPLIGALVSGGLLSILGPLLVYLFMSERPAVRTVAAGAFNFNLLFWVLYLIAWIFAITVIGLLVAVPMFIVIFLVSLYCHIKGAIWASDGRTYRYPFQLKILG